MGEGALAARSNSVHGWLCMCSGCGRSLQGTGMEVSINALGWARVAYLLGLLGGWGWVAEKLGLGECDDPGPLRACRSPGVSFKQRLVAQPTQALTASSSCWAARAAWARPAARPRWPSSLQTRATPRSWCPRTPRTRWATRWDRCAAHRLSRPCSWPPSFAHLAATSGARQARGAHGPRTPAGRLAGPGAWGVCVDAARRGIAWVGFVRASPEQLGGVGCDHVGEGACLDGTKQPSVTAACPSLTAAAPHPASHPSLPARCSPSAAACRCRSSHPWGTSPSQPWRPTPSRCACCVCWVCACVCALCV